MHAYFNHLKLHIILSILCNIRSNTMKVFIYCKTTSPVSWILRGQAGIVGWGRWQKTFGENHVILTPILNLTSVYGHYTSKLVQILNKILPREKDLHCYKKNGSYCSLTEDYTIITQLSSINYFSSQLKKITLIKLGNPWTTSPW